MILNYFNIIIMFWDGEKYANFKKCRQMKQDPGWTNKQIPWTLLSLTVHMSSNNTKGLK